MALPGAASAQSCTISGTAAANTLTGTAGPDVICGLGGNDIIKGMGGDDTLVGGEGNDTFLATGTASDGRDSIDGGNGIDHADYSARMTSVRLANQSAGPGESGRYDTSTGTSIEQDLIDGVEKFTGGLHNDHITGDSARNTLNGLDGNDVLVGGDLVDTFDGGPGDDTIRARDTYADPMDCGLGNDTVYRDVRDTMLTRCERSSTSATADRTDLVAELVESADPIRRLGSVFTMHAIAHNPGGAPAVFTRMIFTSELEIVGIPPGMTCVLSDGNHRADCTIGTMPADSSNIWSFKLKTLEFSLPRYRTTLELVSDTPDPVPSNNTTEEHTDVIGVSDLAISIDDDADDPSLTGEDVLYRLRAANIGPDEAHHAQVTFAVPAGAAVVSSDSTCVLDGATFTCTRTSPLASGDTWIVDIRLRYAQPDTYSSSATVGFAPPAGAPSWFDPDTSNNSDSEQTKIKHLSLAPASVEENVPAGTTVGTLAVLAPEFGYTFSLPADPARPDNAAFAIDGTTLKTGPGTALNYEAKSVYSISVRGTSTDGGVVTKDFTVTIIDVNEPPASVTLSNGSVPENTAARTTIGTLAALGDPESPPQTHNFTLPAGGDNDSFQIAGNELQVKDPLDYESKSSYTISVRATDSGSPSTSRTESFTITVLDVNEPPTSVSLSDDTVAENTATATTIGTLSALGDPESPPQTHGFSLPAGSGDNDSFQIVGDELQTKDPLDYESKSSYTITVDTTDSGSPATGRSDVFTITVGDVNEAPTNIGLSNSSINEENAPNAIVGALSTTDPDTGGSHTYSLVNSAGGKFAISGTNLVAAQTLNYDGQPHSYDVVVRTSDGALTFDKTFTVTVNPVNEAPNSLTNTPGTVKNGDPVGTTAATLAATDPDIPGQTLTFSLPAGGDNGSFTIAGNTIKTNFVAAYATKSSYSITARVSDGSLTRDLAITVTIAPPAGMTAVYGRVDQYKDLGIEAVPTGTASTHISNQVAHYEGTVTNNGTTTLNNVVLTIDAPSGLGDSEGFWNPPAASCGKTTSGATVQLTKVYTTGKWVCTVGTLEAGKIATLHGNFIYRAAGNYTATFTATADGQPTITMTAPARVCATWPC